MYLDFFHLKQHPFTLTPNPRFLFLTERHREALAHLFYGVSQDGGFVQLTGEVGTGKTTLCRCLVENAPENVDVALVLNPRQTPSELVSTLCEELGVPVPEGTCSLKALIDRLNRHLLENHARGRRTVAILDEAQDLYPETLEQVRLLTNLETESRKLLQIFLVGQPELREILKRPELRQLAQRITARYHLGPMTPGDTAGYVRHRLEVAGREDPLLTPGALRSVHRLSGGIPRLVNIVCERALLGAYGLRKDRVDRRLIRRAHREVMGLHAHGPPTRRILFWGMGAAALAALLLIWYQDPSSLLGDLIQRPTAPGGDAAAPVVSKRDVPRPSAPPARTEKRSVSTASSPNPVGPPTVEREQTSQESVPPGNFATHLERGTSGMDLETAFSILMKSWKRSLPGPRGGDPCLRIAAAGLRCLRGKGSWMRLRHIDRPVVLEFRTGPKRRYAALLGLRGPQATLGFGDLHLTISTESMDPFWLGDFILVWNAPSLSSRLLKKGMKGPDILWLRKQLDLGEGTRMEDSSHPASPVFDEALEQRVRRFQREHALLVDGMVGEKTLFELMRVTGELQGPRLSDTTRARVGKSGPRPSDHEDHRMEG
ncbi:MAG: AAA family ATPase [Deltaproteobacteria bacterium]|nr:AAA family ATPase [Deltaproteobacteria bacterium]MBW1949694.1 AAA family ATPase [Deltaproteobacteria bacterium]MBW2008814.1 AAA family ATPase [Deltaproteobacteria bacterium]